MTIVEASRATREKYAAGFGLLQESLQPAGFQRETFAGKAAHPLDAERIGLIKDFVTDQMQRFSIPGAGLSLIEGGRIVFEGGFGVKTLGKPDPVGADTLFLAASDTKAMTTLLLAELVDEGKLRWDQPVTEVYPSFRLGDTDTTRQVKIRHLVCACTGFRARTWNGCSTTRTRRPNRHWRCSGPCSRPAGSARSFSTAT